MKSNNSRGRSDMGSIYEAIERGKKHMNFINTPPGEGE